MLASGALRVKGPQHLRDLYLEGNLLLKAKPQDVLTVLRPAGVADPRDSFIRLDGVPPIHSEVRGAKFFYATCEDSTRFAYRKVTRFTDEQEQASKTGLEYEEEGRPFRFDALPKEAGRALGKVEAPDLTLPDYSFELSVMYAMRQHTVHKTYKEFVALHRELAKEVLLMPGFPKFSMPARVLDPAALGESLAGYLTRLHHSLAERGVFSPRLMDFCLVDVHRVHIEEEMRVTKLLGDNVLKGSYWQVVDEKWLVKWRRFVSGRGARRYLPPCAISNDALLHWEKAVFSVRYED